MGLYTGLCYVMCEILLFFSTKKDPTNRYRLDNFNVFLKFLYMQNSIILIRWDCFFGCLGVGSFGDGVTFGARSGIPNEYFTSI